MFLKFNRNKKIKKNYDFLEPEETLFHKEAISKLNEGDEEMIPRLEVKVGDWGLRLIFYFFLIFLIFSTFYVFYLSIWQGRKFQALAERNATQKIFLPAERGIIYDRFGKALVNNSQRFELIFYPQYLPANFKERKAIFEKIKNWPEIQILIEKNNFSMPQVLKSNLNLSEAIFWESQFLNYPAFQIVRQNLRHYYNPFANSHLVGYLGRVTNEDFQKNPFYQPFEWIGKTGIEGYYNDFLRGELGEITIFQKANLEILNQALTKIPREGYQLYLTIDSELQNYLYQRLEKQIKDLGSNSGGVAIVLESKTGKILALVSYPGFDINKLTQGITSEEFQKLVQLESKPLFNRAISGLYNPGSTIKPFLAIAGLEEHLINPLEKIETKGYLEIPNPYDSSRPSIFPDWKNHGWIDLKDAIARSSNVYFYILGGGYQQREGLGIERIVSYFKKFFFDQPTGIDLPGEKIGVLPNFFQKDWRLGDTYNVSIGQGEITVTPLRLLISLNALVNGGKILKPYILEKAIDTQGKIIFQNHPQIIAENLFKKENLEIVKKAMRATVESPFGTGYFLNDLPFAVGGKSGTAQTKAKTKINALFFAFAPADDPSLSILVLIEDAKEGALNALPVVKDALLFYYKKRGL